MMVSGSGVRQVPRFLLCGFGGVRRAVLETEAVVSGFENVAAVGETVEQRGRHLGVAEHGGPLAEAEISRDDDAGFGLSQYEAAFRDNAIDAQLLPELKAEDLKDLGVT